MRLAGKLSEWAKNFRGWNPKEKRNSSKKWLHSFFWGLRLFWDHVITQDICNRFIEIEFFVGCMACPWLCLLHHQLAVKLLISYFSFQTTCLFIMRILPYNLEDVKTWFLKGLGYIVGSNKLTKYYVVHTQVLTYFGSNGKARTKSMSDFLPLPQMQNWYHLPILKLIIQSFTYYIA